MTMLRYLLFACTFSLITTPVYSAPTDADLAEVGLKYADALNMHDVEALHGLINLNALALRAAALFSDDQRLQSQYKRGFLMGAGDMADRMIEVMKIEQGWAHFVRIREIDGVRGPLIRYDYAEGTNYVLLKSTDGQSIDDFYVVSDGNWTSATVGVLSSLLVSPSRSLIGRVFGLDTVDPALMENFQALSRYRRSRDFQAALDIIDQFPEKIRNTRAIVNIGLELSMMISEPLYRRELERLAKHHGNDPTVVFYLIDHYFLREQYEDALDAIENLERLVGVDAATLLMRSGVWLTVGDIDAAHDLTHQALELEPDNPEGYWTLLTVFLTESRYDESADILKLLEEAFGYVMDPDEMSRQEVYAGFIQSDAYQAWLAQRPANEPATTW